MGVGASLVSAQHTLFDVNVGLSLVAAKQLRSEAGFVIQRNLLMFSNC